jgi:hypothetical protein
MSTSAGIEYNFSREQTLIAMSQAPSASGIQNSHLQLAQWYAELADTLQMQRSAALSDRTAPRSVAGDAGQADQGQPPGRTSRTRAGKTELHAGLHWSVRSLRAAAASQPSAATARAHAPDPEEGSNPAARHEQPPAAGPLRRLRHRVQYRTTARSSRHEMSRRGLHCLNETL